jgi:GxxExxY protein
MIDKQYKHSELTSKIIGCAIEVHKGLGCGFQEVIYQRALEHEFTLQKVKYAREVDMPIFYKDKHLGTRRVDFLIEGKVLLEIKAVVKLEKVHLAQAKNYLEAYKIEVGLLLNFGSINLDIKRLMK